MVVVYGTKITLRREEQKGVRMLAERISVLFTTFIRVGTGRKLRGNLTKFENQAESGLSPVIQFLTKPHSSCFFIDYIANIQPWPDHSNAPGPDDPDPDTLTISSASSFISTTSSSSAEYEEEAARSRRRHSVMVIVSAFAATGIEIASNTLRLLHQHHLHRDSAYQH